MKRHTIFAGLLLLCMTSCSLDLEDPKNLSSSSFWKTSKDAWNNLNSCYAVTVPGVAIYDDAYVDIVRCPYPWESNGATFKQNSLSAGDNEGYDFNGVRMCNVFLANIGNVDLEEPIKKRMIAEARVLRAWNYMSLTLDFGKVPLITEPVNYDIRSFDRDKAETIREFVLSELKEAAQDLPKSYSGGYLNEKTRITKYAALSLRARAALYFGDYKSAEADAKRVMDEGGYSLHRISTLPAGTEKEVAELDKLIDYARLGVDRNTFLRGVFSYRSIWDMGNVTSDAPECIIVKEYLPGNPDYVDLIRYTNMRPDQMVFGWSSVVPTQNLVDMYWDAKGNKFDPPTVEERSARYLDLEKAYKAGMKAGSKSFIALANDWIDSGELFGHAYIDEFRNRDARLYASIIFPFKRISDTDAGDSFVYEWKNNAKNESTTGFNFIKMVARSTNTMLWGAYPCSEVNYPVMRYAELLLIYAEAHTHNATYDASVQSALNQIRSRSGMPDVPTALSKEEALSLIRNERCIELAGEGQRYYDIKRYDEAYVKKCMGNVPIVKPNGEKVLTMQWNNRMRLKPLPQTAIDLNPGLQNDQNPGY